MDTEKLIKIVNFIEENIRASVKKRMKFIDTKNYQNRIMVKQNHVVYGRRGAGKSMLISSIKPTDDIYPISVNVEDYKDISFPNIIVSVLQEIMLGFKAALKRKKLSIFSFKYRILISELKRFSRELKILILENDFSIEGVKTKSSRRVSMGLRGKSNVAEGAIGTASQNEIERTRQVTHSKMDYLLTQISPIKRLINDISAYLNDCTFFLLLDDLYFVPKTVQPDFIDYFHRLTKDTVLSLKVSTIRHRSLLYRQTKESFIGVESGHDILEIDMDYSLDSFGELADFMKRLLDAAALATVGEFNFDTVFSGAGFNQLCIASGGVPRDFLYLFVQLSNRIASGSISSIGKIDVNDAAIANFRNKTAFMRTDSLEERNALEKYLEYIRNLIYREKRTNAFLIAKNEIENNLHERQAIRELLDLRLIHLVVDNISKAPSDGRRYEAYIVDVGMYDNSRPRSFTQIEPGQRDMRSRMDSLRASPVISIERMKRDLALDESMLLLPSFPPSS